MDDRIKKSVTEINEKISVNLEKLQLITSIEELKQKCFDLDILDEDKSPKITATKNSIIIVDYSQYNQTHLQDDYLELCTEIIELDNDENKKLYDFLNSINIYYCNTEISDAFGEDESVIFIDVENNKIETINEEFSLIDLKRAFKTFM